MAYTPLQQYAAYNPSQGLTNLQNEKNDRLNKLKSVYAAQNAGLDASQLEANRQLDQNVNRFAAQNRLSPGSGSLLKYSQDQQEKNAQANALNKAQLGGQQAQQEEALNSEIGQRGFQEQQLGEQSRQFGSQANLAMNESEFNRATAAFQSVLAAHSEGLKSQTDWNRMLSGPNGFLSRLFGGQGVDLGAGFLEQQEQQNRARRF